jgi:hypothetical protein
MARKPLQRIPLQLARRCIRQMCSFSTSIQRPSAFHDRHGGVTPFAQTVGTGTGLLLRDGRLWNVKWGRATEADPTVWTDAATGAPVSV